MGTGPTPSNSRSDNPLRPTTLDGMIGQAKVKRLLRTILDACLRRSVPLDHVLLVAPSGVGKSTVANIIANELGVDCYQVEAPISHETLLALRPVMLSADILFVDEVHQQAIMERRGKSSATQPEVLYNVMEDRRIVSGMGVLEFPAITVIGATTDEGMLPDPFINRFPLRPVLERYTQEDLARIAKANADVFGIDCSWEAARIFARASRGIPRHINNYVRNAAMLDDHIGVVVADTVVRELNRTTDDGLSLDMQNVLVFLYRRCRRINGEGTTTYQASVGTIATAIGKARDTKAVQLRIEPYLIERGFLQVGHGGRSLTPAGLRRAKELSRDPL